MKTRMFDDGRRTATLSLEELLRLPLRGDQDADESVSTVLAWAVWYDASFPEDFFESCSVDEPEPGTLRFTYKLA